MIGSNVQERPGGKGANRATAATVSGAQTHLVARLGDDQHAQLLRDRPREAKVDTTHVRMSDLPTGIAVILLTPDEENSIIVSPGANHALGVHAAEEAEHTWTQADVVVLSREIPPDTVRHVAGIASAAGVRVVLNAAPSGTVEPDVLAVCNRLSSTNMRRRTWLVTRTRRIQPS